MTDFEKKMHHDGRLYGWAMLIAICAFPFFASVRSGIWPDFKIIWPGVLTMWILMASYVLSEMIAFPPILGPGSLYLTYITGNLQNQKIPCALSAMSIAGIEAGSEKANAVSVNYRCGSGSIQYHDNGNYCLGNRFDAAIDPIVKFFSSSSGI